MSKWRLQRRGLLASSVADSFPDLPQPNLPFLSNNEINKTATWIDVGQWNIGGWGLRNVEVISNLKESNLSKFYFFFFMCPGTPTRQWLRLYRMHWTSKSKRQAVFPWIHAAEPHTQTTTHLHVVMKWRKNLLLQ